MTLSTLFYHSDVNILGKKCVNVVKVYSYQHCIVYEYIKAYARVNKRFNLNRLIR
ncbi:hypothetical protein MACH07_26340 [Flagellimonas marinaquae]|uniref:Uncharacterized protein n=1 Tax=Flagellimonas marinaquae TaxID=254955 RepID=A0AA48HCW4_9FLAO|nr:hypothetical protein MACH07_26340 [Allomuricauda aquimarina]